MESLLKHMWHTWKQNLKHLSVEDYKWLKELCGLSACIYNTALYNVRQRYFKDGKYLRYEENYYSVKDLDIYKRLGASMSQQAMRQVDTAFSTFFSLVKLYGHGSNNDVQVNIPAYLPKGSLYPIYMNIFTIREDGMLLVPMSIPLRKETTHRILIRVPSKIRNRNIKMVTIVPKCNGRWFEARYAMDSPDADVTPLNNRKALSIDLGVNNFATCATSEGDAFIIDGRKIKSYNQWFNKELARLSAIKNRQHIVQFTKQQHQICRKRANRMHDFIHCSAKYIVTYCKNHHIGNIVIGHSDRFQHSCRNLNKVTRQTFVELPFGQFIDALSYRCEQEGINLVEQEESYTSKASFFDNDAMPTWDGTSHPEYRFSGKRVKRGLYCTSTNHIVNADVNGALNILRKSNLDLAFSKSLEQPRGAVVSPERIRIA